MPRVKTSRLSMDESVLANCPEMQSIPLGKTEIGSVSNFKISRPQRADYMFNNIGLNTSVF